jgi:hypothetical protein
MKAIASVPICSTVVGTEPPVSADTAIVEGDDAVMSGDAVDDAWVPVVEDRGQVVQEHHRNV